MITHIIKDTSSWTLEADFQHWSIGVQIYPGENELVIGLHFLFLHLDYFKDKGK